METVTPLGLLMLRNCFLDFANISLLYCMSVSYSSSILMSVGSGHLVAGFGGEKALGGVNI